MDPQTITKRAAWHRALLALPAPHLLQTWEWGEVKAQTGWTAQRLLWTQPATGAPAAAASLLLRRVSRLPWGVAYVPKGPLLDWDDPARGEQALAGVEAAARQGRAIFVDRPRRGPRQPGRPASAGDPAPPRLAALG